MTAALLPDRIDFDGPFPPQSRRLRLGIVGGGRIAAMQATAARLSGRWDILAGALSSDPEKARARGETWYLDPARCYASFDEMAKQEAARDDGVDAVMITTPNHLHYPAACAFLERGIDVLCDKPLTNERSEADDLVARTRETGQVFGVSYLMSCFPMVRQARELIEKGTVGTINQIHVEFMQDWMTPSEVADADHVKWRLDPAKSGKTSCVGDIGTHAAHLASFVSGLTLAELRADFHVCGAPKPLEDTAFMNLRFAECVPGQSSGAASNQVPGTLMVTRLAPGNRGGLRLRIFGSRGGLAWDLEHCDQLKVSIWGQPDHLMTRGHGHGVSPATERLLHSARGFGEGILEAWANLYTEFALAVAARRDGISPPDGWLSFPRVSDGARGVAFVDAAFRSHQAGGQWEAV